LATTCSIASELIAKIARARDQLLVFCPFPGQVEPTNNGCERALRPAVIQRKVTNGYRAMWAAEYETAVRSTVDTARLAGAGSFQTMPSNHQLIPPPRQLRDEAAWVIPQQFAHCIIPAPRTHPPESQADGLAPWWMTPSSRGARPKLIMGCD
jgi:hypothetical protein